MKRRVVDASVIAAAFFHETHADEAGAVLAGRAELHAPDLVFAELANVIWKRHRRNEIDEIEATALVSDLLALPLHTAPGEGLVESAIQMAILTGRSVYDCQYVALAAQLRCVMVTCDQRLVNGLSGTPMSRHVELISDSD